MTSRGMSRSIKTSDLEEDVVQSLHRLRIRLEVQNMVYACVKSVYHIHSAVPETVQARRCEKAKERKPDQDSSALTAIRRNSSLSHI
jgi:hypothetical protein